MSEIRVPSLGESVTEATVATWFKKQGDSVEVDELLCELETDKVTVEVPSPIAGVLSEIIANEGDSVGVDALLAHISQTDATENKQDNTPKTHDTPTKPATQNSVAVPAQEDKTTAAAPKNAPSAQKLASERGLDIQSIAGTGRDGRVMRDDIINAHSPQNGQTQIQSEPREQTIKMTRLRKTIATRLKEAQNTAAMLTTYNEADMSAVMALRNEYKDLFLKKHGMKLGFMSFFTKACCHALHEVPEVNAEIRDDSIVYKNYVNMGVAVGTPNGLVVPVIRDAHQMSFAQIETAIAEAGARARDGKLAISEMQDGTFTISNGGVYGSLMSSPILNPPQSGILGMHKIQERAVVIDGQIVARPMMYLALSYDHRIVDGKGAVTFLVRVKELLEDPRRLLMDL